MAEVDESNGEEKTEPVSEMETSVKGQHLGYILALCLNWISSVYMLTQYIYLLFFTGLWWGYMIY